MKNDKLKATAKGKKKSSGKNAAVNSGQQSSAGAPDTIAAPGASEIKKARAGRGLANEGTIVSYEEQR
jgi:hypothetical protein